MSYRPRRGRIIFLLSPKQVNKTAKMLSRLPASGIFCFGLTFRTLILNICTRWNRNNLVSLQLN